MSETSLNSKGAVISAKPNTKEAITVSYTHLTLPTN